MLCEQLLDFGWIQETLHRLLFDVDVNLGAGLSHGFVGAVESGDGQYQVDANGCVAGYQEDMFPVESHLYFTIILFTI
jgi:hypothetical protein